MIEKNWKSLIKPFGLDVKYRDSELRDADIVLEPLERGFGHTIGNALRRVLLSSIRGSAITAVQIEGVMHEFSTIPGVLEDCTDVILNLKGIYLKLLSDMPKKVRINIKGPRIVTAADIDGGAFVEVLNPDAFICTLDREEHLNMELTVENGKGYMAASQQEGAFALNLIKIDALFSPIRSVSYKIDPIRVGQRTDHDKLTLKVTTDGSLKPDDAVAYAARILQVQLQNFINFDEASFSSKIKERKKLLFDKNFLRKIDDLELSVRSANCLKGENIFYVGDLIKKTESEMLKTPNFGRKSLNELRIILDKMGLTFGMDIPNWPPEDIEDLIKNIEE